jgi:sugar phosphate isomerase/epimerase
MTPEGLKFTEVGEGNLNWPAILDACKKAGTKHYIVEQDANWVRNSAFKSLEVAYENLTGMGLT